MSHWYKNYFQLTNTSEILKCFQIDEFLIEFRLDGIIKVTFNKNSTIYTYQKTTYR